MNVEDMLSRYEPKTADMARTARRLLLDALPGVGEEADPAAGVIGYGYEPGYKGLICTLILSKKGVKLGFYRGAQLPDPHQLLQGAGKVHRYVEIGAPAPEERALGALIVAAATAYRARSQKG
jgi:hypothetical protein